MPVDAWVVLVGWGEILRVLQGAPSPTPTDSAQQSESSPLILLLWFGGVAAVAWDAWRKKRNPWAWGTMAFFLPVFGAVGWFWYWWRKTHPNPAPAETAPPSRPPRRPVSRAGNVETAEPEEEHSIVAPATPPPAQSNLRVWDEHPNPQEEPLASETVQADVEETSNEQDEERNFEGGEEKDSEGLVLEEYEPRLERDEEWPEYDIPGWGKVPVAFLGEEWAILGELDAPVEKTLRALAEERGWDLAFDRSPRWRNAHYCIRIPSRKPLRHPRTAQECLKDTTGFTYEEGFRGTSPNLPAREVAWDEESLRHILRYIPGYYAVVRRLRLAPIVDGVQYDDGEHLQFFFVVHGKGQAWRRSNRSEVRKLLAVLGFQSDWRLVFGDPGANA